MAVKPPIIVEPLKLRSLSSNWTLRCQPSHAMATSLRKCLSYINHKTLVVFTSRLIQHPAFLRSSYFISLFSLPKSSQCQAFAFANPKETLFLYHRVRETTASLKSSIFERLTSCEYVVYHDARVLITDACGTLRFELTSLPESKLIRARGAEVRSYTKSCIGLGFVYINTAAVNLRRPYGTE